MELIPQDEHSEEMEDKKEEFIENIEEITEKNTEKPVAVTTMVDTSEIFGIEVINGNTGERKTLTTEDANLYNDLIELYTQLDFSAECAENTRVGYQYSMKLQDADGNKLQSVTPYKDGLAVDRVFYQYEDTSNGAGIVASVR